MDKRVCKHESSDFLPRFDRTSPDTLIKIYSPSPKKVRSQQGEEKKKNKKRLMKIEIPKCESISEKLGEHEVLAGFLSPIKSPNSIKPKCRSKFNSLTISVGKSKFGGKKRINLSEKYEILETLGVGTYSTVKAAIEKFSDRPVAIKT